MTTILVLLLSATNIGVTVQPLHKNVCCATKTFALKTLKIEVDIILQLKENSLCGKNSNLIG